MRSPLLSAGPLGSRPLDSRTRPSASSPPARVHAPPVPHPEPRPAVSAERRGVLRRAGDRAARPEAELRPTAVPDRSSDRRAQAPSSSPRSPRNGRDTGLAKRWDLPGLGTPGRSDALRRRGGARQQSISATAFTRSFPAGGERRSGVGDRPLRLRRGGRHHPRDRRERSASSDRAFSAARRPRSARDRPHARPRRRAHVHRHGCADALHRRGQRLARTSSTTGSTARSSPSAEASRQPEGSAFFALAIGRRIDLRVERRAESRA